MTETSQHVATPTGLATATILAHPAVVQEVTVPEQPAYTALMQGFVQVCPLVPDETGSKFFALVAADFAPDAYPQLDLPPTFGDPTERQKNVLMAVRALYEGFGHTLPASFYHLILLGLHQTETGLLARDDGTVDPQRCQQLLDSTLHALLLTTPLDDHIRQVLSRYQLSLGHMHNCSCIVPDYDGPPLPTNLLLDEAQRQSVLARFFWCLLDEYILFQHRTQPILNR